GHLIERIVAICLVLPRRSDHVLPPGPVSGPVVAPLVAVPHLGFAAAAGLPLHVHGAPEPLLRRDSARISAERSAAMPQVVPRSGRTIVAGVGIARVADGFACDPAEDIVGTAVRSFV